jgi:hypothetical protein
MAFRLKNSGFRLRAKGLGMLGLGLVVKIWGFRVLGF